MKLETVSRQARFIAGADLAESTRRCGQGFSTSLSLPRLGLLKPTFNTKLRSLSPRSNGGRTTMDL